MRAATFSEPRALTLMTKYAGAPAVNVWSGSAVMVVSKSDARRVEIGPKALRLEYDETLAVLRVSTGLPKSSAAQAELAYLPLRDQRIRDRTNVRTRDHVAVALELSMTVRFEGDAPERWFAVGSSVLLPVEGGTHLNVEPMTAIRFDGSSRGANAAASLRFRNDGVMCVCSFVLRCWVRPACVELGP